MLVLMDQLTASLRFLSYRCASSESQQYLMERRECVEALSALAQSIQASRNG